MKFAAIDIGSNAVRLLFKNIYESQEGPLFHKDSIIRVPLRLGEEAFVDGKFSETKISELIKTMLAFRYMMEVHHIKAYRAFATSAMREASNGTEAVKRIQEETSLKIEVISGKKEARVIMNNHLEQNKENDEKAYLYIDVGGGSTELVYFTSGKVLQSQSFKIGTLRLLNNQVSTESWKEMRSWLEENRPVDKKTIAVGSGGNINKIIKLYGKPSNNSLSRQVIKTVHDYLESLSISDRIKDLGLKPDRADVIVPASLIFRNVLLWAKIDNIIVPKFGLADGIIRDLYYDYKEAQEKWKLDYSFLL